MQHHRYLEGQRQRAAEEEDKEGEQQQPVAPKKRPLSFRPLEEIDPNLGWQSRLQASDDARKAELDALLKKERETADDGRVRRRKIGRIVKRETVQAAARELIVAAGGKMRCAALKKALYDQEFTRDQVESALTLGRFGSKKDTTGAWWRTLPPGEEAETPRATFELDGTQNAESDGDMANKLESMAAAARGDLFYYDPETLTIIDDPSHALFDERHALELDPEMVKNIKEMGVIKPIVIKKGPVVDGKPQILVVDGRQRTAHARQANKELRAEGAAEDRLVLVPAIYRRGGDEDGQAVMAAANSYNRTESPTMLGRKLVRLTNAGRPDQWLCNHFKLSVADLERHRRLVEMDESVQKAVDAGDFSIKAIDSLERLPPKKQAEAVEALKNSGKSGPRETKQVVDAANPEHQPAPAPAAPEEKGPKRLGSKAVERQIAEYERRAGQADNEMAKRAYAVAIAALRLTLGHGAEELDKAIAAFPDACGACGVVLPGSSSGWSVFAPGGALVGNGSDLAAADSVACQHRSAQQDRDHVGGAELAAAPVLDGNDDHPAVGRHVEHPLSAPVEHHTGAQTAR